jgi:hypothetical protein
MSWDLEVIGMVRIFYRIGYPRLLFTIGIPDFDSCKIRIKAAVTPGVQVNFENFEPFDTKGLSKALIFIGYKIALFPYF